MRKSLARGERQSDFVLFDDEPELAVVDLDLELSDFASDFFFDSLLAAFSPFL